MSNEIPKTYTDVVALAEDAADGAKTHAAAIGLKQNTEAPIRADLMALTTAEETVAVRRAAKAAANNVHKTKDSNGKAFIARFIQLETPRIGSDWGPLWEQAGFTGGSISNPRTLDERFILLDKLAKFLKNNPTYAVTDAARPDLDVTEAAAQACYDAISNAREVINETLQANGAAMGARDAALAAMRARLSGLRNELTQLPLPDDSPIWYAFGLNRPSDPATPGVPDSLVLTAGGPGTLIVDWAPSRRATGYRVKVEVAGEPQPRVYGLMPDDQAVIPGLPTGKLLTVTAIAHNEAGDSQPSAPATITLV